MLLRKGQTQLKLVPPYQQWALDLLTKADYDEYWQHPSYAPVLFSDDFPDVNPNTGDPIGQERRRQGADNRVHHNAAQASHVVLPIIPT